MLLLYFKEFNNNNNLKIINSENKFRFFIKLNSNYLFNNNLKTNKIFKIYEYDNRKYYLKNKSKKKIKLSRFYEYEFDNKFFFIMILYYFYNTNCYLVY
jgi:hypothetical protein